MRDDRPLTLSPHQLRALAHPLRIQILGVLRTDGSATATVLAARLGESTGSTSYHLRQLAVHGFVEEDPDLAGRGRERWWRSAYTSTRFNDGASDFFSDPQTRGAMDVFLHTVLTEHFKRTATFVSDKMTWDQAWLDACEFSDYLLRLTPDRLGALTAEVGAVIERYRDDPSGESADAEQVIVGFQAFPRRPEDGAGAEGGA